jgi:hypothetical protein
LREAGRQVSDDVIIVIGKAMFGVDCGGGTADQNSIRHDALKMGGCT